MSRTWQTITLTLTKSYPALQLLSFYNWAELILQRMDQNLFWEEIKVVLGTIIQEKLGKEADTVHTWERCTNHAGLDSGTVSLFALTSDLTNSETVAATL